MSKLLDSWIAGVPAAMFVLGFAMLISLVCQGCNNAGPSEIIQGPDGQGAEFQAAGVRDFDHCLDNGDCYSGYVYDNGTALGSSKIALTYQDKNVKPLADILESNGYQFRADGSEYIVSETTDGAPIWTVLEVWTGPAAPGEASLAIVKYTSIRNYGYSIQLEAWYAGSNPGDYWIDGGMPDMIGLDDLDRMFWVQSFEPEIRILLNGHAGSPLLDPPIPDADPDQWDWWQWIKCTSAGAGAGCAAGAAWCSMDPDYGGCVDEACESSFYASAIGCASDQIFH